MTSSFRSGAPAVRRAPRSHDALSTSFTIARVAAHRANRTTKNAFEKCCCRVSQPFRSVAPRTELRRRGIAHSPATVRVAGRATDGRAAGTEVPLVDRTSVRPYQPGNVTSRRVKRPVMTTITRLATTSRYRAAPHDDSDDTERVTSDWPQSVTSARPADSVGVNLASKKSSFESTASQRLNRPWT